MRRTVIRTALLAALVSSAGGCATMHANKMTQYRRAETDTRTGSLSPLRLRGFMAGDRVYADGQEVPVEILMSEGDMVSASRTCQFVFGEEADDAARARQLIQQCPNFITIGVFLDRSRPHTLRIARGAADYTTNVRASWRFKWFWIDGLFGPGAFVAWAMDASSGAWREFGSLDLGQAFAGATATR